MAKKRTQRKQRDAYPRIHHVSAPQHPGARVVEELIGAPNGKVLILRIEKARFGYIPQLLTIDKRGSLPVSFGSEDPKSMQEAFRMAKAWLDSVGMRGAN